MNTDEEADESVVSGSETVLVSAAVSRHAGALRHFDSPRLGAPRLHHFDGSQAQFPRRSPERSPLPRPRVLEGDHASIVRHQSFLSAALYGLVPLDAIDATL